jgi:hypothetical protein
MGNMTGNIILLHLSDLHFGDKNETNCAKRTNTLNKLLLTLKKLPTEWKPQSIAISGDIGWHKTLPVPKKPRPNKSTVS